MRIPLAVWLALGLLTGCLPSIDTSSGNGSKKKENADESKDDQYDGKGIFGKTTRKLVDKKAAMAENPNLIVVNANTAAGRNSQSGSTYTFAVSFFGSLPLQKYVQHHKALEGRTPTYAEMDAWMKMNPGVTLPLIEQWRMYGYDEEAGTIVILEDPKVMERIYKEKGIPLE